MRYPAAAILVGLLVTGCATAAGEIKEQPAAVKCVGLIAVGAMFVPALAAGTVVDLAAEVIVAPIVLMVNPDKAFPTWKALKALKDTEIKNPCAK